MEPGRCWVAPSAPGARSRRRCPRLPTHLRAIARESHRLVRSPWLAGGLFVQRVRPLPRLDSNCPARAHGCTVGEGIKRRRLQAVSPKHGADVGSMLGGMVHDLSEHNARGLLAKLRLDLEVWIDASLQQMLQLLAD